MCPLVFTRFCGQEGESIVTHLTSVGVVFLQMHFDLTEYCVVEPPVAIFSQLPPVLRASSMDICFLPAVNLVNS
jgi:hypothetical protein